METALRTAAWLSATLFLLLVVCAKASIFLVDPEGTGTHPTIQAAIDAAIDGDIVELTSGTFTGEGNRDLDFGGKALIVRSQDGDPQLCILDCEGSFAEPHRGFTFRNGEDTTAVVSGLTMTMGVGLLGESNHYYGGALYCEGSSPKIHNCIVDRNYATMGGGLYCTATCSVLVSECTFTRNSDSAVSCRYGPTPTFRDCVFSENWCDGTGGAVFALEAVLRLVGCRFAGNLASSDGGGIFLWRSGSTLVDCIFEYNEAFWWGGGLNADSEQPPHLIGCAFSGNSAHHGGGIRLEWCPAVLTDCVFRDNTADAGGGIYTKNGLPVLTRCTIEANTARVGGGVACCGSPTFDKCTIAENEAPDGAGVYCWRDEWHGWADPVFDQTLVAFNTLGEGLLCAYSPNITLTCCDIYGNEGGDWTGLIADQLGASGNICADPLFCRDLNPEEPLSLHALSPCAPGSNPECGQIGAWPVACGWEAVPGGGGRHSTGLWLSACRPNPARGQVGVSFAIPPELAGRPLRLLVFDSAGRLVRTLMEHRAQAGVHRTTWNREDDRGRRVPAGIYFADLRVWTERSRGRLVLLE